MAANNKAEGDLVAVIVSNASVGNYPMSEISGDDTTIGYLIPLLVILLATLLGIIALFSCILCTCTLKDSKAAHNSAKVTPRVSALGLSTPYEGPSPPTPPIKRKDTGSDTYCTLPVIAAYKTGEIHAEWCPQYQIETEDELSCLTEGGANSRPIVTINTAEEPPWRLNTITNNKDDDESSANTIDRVTVV